MHTYPLRDSEPETQTGVSARETSEASRGTESSVTQAPTLQPLAGQPPLPPTSQLLGCRRLLSSGCPAPVLEPLVPLHPSHPPTKFTWVLHRRLGPTQVTAPATCYPKVTPCSLPSLLRISTHQLCRCRTSLGLPAPNFIHNVVRVHAGLTGAPGKTLKPPVILGHIWSPLAQRTAGPGTAPASCFGSTSHPCPFGLCSPPHQLHRGDFPQPPFLSLPRFSLLPTDS